MDDDTDDEDGVLVETCETCGKLIVSDDGEECLTCGALVSLDD